jgi:hypothetical protein
MNSPSQRQRPLFPLANSAAIPPIRFHPQSGNNDIMVCNKYLASCIALLVLVCACSTAPPALVTTQETPSECSGVNANEGDSFPAYIPSLMSTFVTLADGQFWVADTVFQARGVNYYPARFPWRRFLTESELDVIKDELLLLRTVGFNTLRLFLWNEALFLCSGENALPNSDAFNRLDAVIHESAAQGFRLIVTLNDLPDAALYTNPAYNQEQTRFIVERYRNEAAILAWDLRNEGDIDYGSNDALGRGRFARGDVLNWLRQTAELVRGLDSQHLITAGWLHDSESTAPYVDFLSFHHWDNAGRLRDRITALKGAGKPILLEEFGYSTYRVSPEEQSRMIVEAVRVSDAENLLGWLIWTAFDFPLDATCIRPACPSQDNAEHHFGLWYPDYTPKPIIQALLQR